ncbi:MAG: type II secretion system F family protein [Actinomycetota bacterium]
MTATRWSYAALDASGDARNGVIEADSEAEAAKIVRTLGMRPMAVEPSKVPVFERELSIPGLGPRIKPTEVAATIRQLSTMIGAGVTLRRSLSVLTDQATNDGLKAALADVRDAVEAGSSLSEAFEEQPSVFGPIVVALVRAGESAGALDTVLDQAAESMERSAALRRQIRSTLAYPVSVLGLVTVVLLAMSIFVVPVFRNVYTDLGQELPAATRVVLGVTGFVGSNVLYLALAAAGAVWGLRKWRATAEGRRHIDRALLKVPALGTLLRQAALARTARSLSVLVGAGVPLVDAVQITSSTVGNEVLAEVIRETSEAIQSGKQFSEPLSESDEIPVLFAQVIAVGEESGELEHMLDVVAGVYDDGVDSVSATFSAIIEPLMIGGLGTVVGGLVLALYLPMFRLVDVVQ